MTPDNASHAAMETRNSGGSSANSLSFLGGYVDEASLIPLIPGELLTAGLPGRDRTDGLAEKSPRMFLRQRGQLTLRAAEPSVSLMIRGYMFDRMQNESASRTESMVISAKRLLADYQTTGELSMGELEGCFTLALMDGRREKILLAANLVGNGFTYYCVFRKSIFFGSNLAVLAGLLKGLGRVPELNRERLPAYFLYRTVPGRETLFKGIYRLMPGECVEFGKSGISRRLLQTFEDLRGQTSGTESAIDALESLTARIVADCVDGDTRWANTLSGGIDSTWLQVQLNREALTLGSTGRSFTISIPHERTSADAAYAESAAAALGHEHRNVILPRPYNEYLLESIGVTAEPANHVQSVYFLALARELANQGIPGALCGEGADSLFGMGDSAIVQLAGRVRSQLGSDGLCRAVARMLKWGGRNRWARRFDVASRIRHLPFQNQLIGNVASFCDADMVEACFDRQTIESGRDYRNQLLEQYRAGDTLLERMHAVGFLGEAIGSASLWVSMFNSRGCQLACPFLDSRMLSFALSLDESSRFPWRKPKGLLKTALARHVPAAIVDRRKLGFGQPVFEWMSEGGCLRPLVRKIGHYEFVPAAVLERCLKKPNWFLYSLLCLDVWHKMFIDGEIEGATHGELA